MDISAALGAKPRSAYEVQAVNKVKVKVRTRKKQNCVYPPEIGESVFQEMCQSK